MRALPAPDEFLGSPPEEFRGTAYVHDRRPDASGVVGVVAGANCQLYAYEVLRLHGHDLPPLRSSEVWADDIATERGAKPQPLDLMLFAATDAPYGAHVGLYRGDGKVLHLSAEVGNPAVWSAERFANHPRYRVLIGIKRPRRPTRAT